MSKSLNTNHLDIFLGISIHYNDLETAVYFSLEPYNNSWCCCPLIVNPLVESNSVCMKKMQTVIKLIQNEYLGWACQPQGKIKMSPFKFCHCSESDILNSQVIPFCELVFVKIVRGTSNCNSTYTMNICHICMQIIARSILVVVPISIQDKTIKSYVFNCWVQIVNDNNRTVCSLVNTCHVRQEKCKASLDNVICNKDNLQVECLKNVHTNRERKKK